MQEYRRTCNACGKIWHSLVTRENQVVKSGQTDALNVCAQMCNASAQQQAKRNFDANQSEIVRLRQCPQCGSSSYNEVLVDYSNEPPLPR